MVVFDADGKFVKSWGKDFKGGAHGLHIRKEGTQDLSILCDDKRGLMVKTTLGGEEVFTIGYPKESEAYKGEKKYSPTNLAIAPNGDIYIGDGYGSAISTSTTLKANIKGPLAGRERRRENSTAHTGLFLMTAALNPS